MDTRIVITGIGFLSPIGSTLDTFEAALRSGASGFRPIPYFDTTGFPYDRGAIIVDHPAEYHELSLADSDAETAERYGVHCARRALDDAGLDSGSLNPFRTAVVMASSNAGVETNHRFAEAKRDDGVVAGATVVRTPGTVTAAIRNDLGLRGPQATVSTACAAGSNSVGLALDLLRSGQADVAVAGGAEPFSELSFSGFTLLKSLSHGALRAFDEARDGTGLGEAACVFVLERADDALARGARIYAEIAGYGLSDDAYHATAPDPTGVGAALAIAQCLSDSGLELGDVDYINAHGTGTRYNDVMELTALERVFGDSLAGIPVSSTKPLHGHTLSCAGSIELLVCIVALRGGFVPGNVGTTEPMVEFGGLTLPSAATAAPGLTVAISNSFGFGGNNTCIAIRRVEESA